MQAQVKLLMEKLTHLTPERLAEVDDFIDFLQQRDHDQRLRKDFAHASQDAFQQVWDNDEDAVYDRL